MSAAVHKEIDHVELLRQRLRNVRGGKEDFHGFCPNHKHQRIFVYDASSLDPLIICTCTCKSEAVLDALEIRSDRDRLFLMQNWRSAPWVHPESRISRPSVSSEPLEQRPVKNGNVLPLRPIQEAARRVFPFRVLRDLIAEPAPPRWLLKNWFELGTLGLFFGDPSSCKTWLGLAMGLHIAAGMPWFGDEVRQGAVFVLAGEGHRGIRRRLAGMCQHYGIEATGIPLFVSDAAASLSENESVVDVISEVQKLAEQSGHTPVLVIVDTVSRNLGAADENSTKDMAAFVRSCDWLRNEFDCTVLLLHHPGHADKMRARGSTTLRGALDTEYRITRDNDGAILIEATKAKDFSAPGIRCFTLQNVQLPWLDDDGNPISSAAIIATDVQPARTGKIGRGKNQTIALRILVQAYERHRSNLLADGRDPDAALVTLDEWRDLCAETGIGRYRFREVLKSLSNIGLIRIDGAHVRLTEGYM